MILMKLFLACFLLISTAHAVEPLLQSSHLRHVGAFRLPAGTVPCGAVPTSTVSNCFTYGGYALAFNPANRSLFYSGHAWHPYHVSEVQIPLTLGAPGSTFAALPIAPVLQAFSDALEGKRLLVDPPATDIQLGGMVVDQGRLIISAYSSYDADGSQVLSHFARPLSFGMPGQVIGPVRMANGTLKAGFFSGYMAKVQSGLQSLLGGTHLTGNCCVSIISRTSLGPSAFSFNPQDIQAGNTVNTSALVYYPLAHPTLGQYTGNTDAYGAATAITGIVQPVGTRTVLYVGKKGTGEYCYGPGTNDPAKHLLPFPPANIQHYCYDPVSNSTGPHAYPYIYQMWAYDAVELDKVRRGEKNAWDVLPYALWRFNLPFEANNAHALGGVAYDETSRRVYIAQQGAGQYGAVAIHVFEHDLPQIEADATITIRDGVPFTFERSAPPIRILAPAGANVIINGELQP